MYSCRQEASISLDYIPRNFSRLSIGVWCVVPNAAYAPSICAESLLIYSFILGQVNKRARSGEWSVAYSGTRLCFACLLIIMDNQSKDDWSVSFELNQSFPLVITEHLGCALRMASIWYCKNSHWFKAADLWSSL